MAPFIEFKQKELDVEVAILENVLSQNAGVDDPEKLKHFLYQAWKERHAHYVLLVGDGEVMPIRYMVLDRVTPAVVNVSVKSKRVALGVVEELGLQHDDGGLTRWLKPRRPADPGPAPASS